ncbi:integrase catalytic domain-containing protein [Trichonephila clavipes]|nr:integrase catalytic domain-containing protein [Trichonephila clavipes]
MEQLRVYPASYSKYPCPSTHNRKRLTQNCQWNHVSSNENPVDLISRGLDASDISPKQLWWYGPDFLREELEANLIDFERITSDSDYLKELKPANVPPQLSRNPSVKRSGQLDYSEVNEAELCLIKNLQASAFQEEINFLAKGGCPQAFLYCTRQRFWSLRGRSIARKIVHECVVSFKNKPVVANQLMGSLPRERVNPSFPFLPTGIDYCGPFFIRYKHQRKGTYQKIYVAIFVYLASKAVHLEIVSDLTTDAFLATLKRFVARRGKCATISLDNAKNFVGANRELKRLHNLLKFPEEKLSSYLSSEGISWNFMPLRAPHFGGLWEAGVKSFKFYLKIAVRNLKMTLEEFLTIITQIEGILNSRPITPLSEDIDDLEVLTPGHFLIGRPITSLSEPNLLDKAENTHFLGGKN